METKEETKVETTTEKPAPATETKTEGEGSTTTTDKKEEVVIDYKAELEKVQKEKEIVEKKLGKAEYKLTEKDKEERRAKKEGEGSESEDDDEDDKDKTPDIKKIVDSEVQRAKREIAEDNVREILDQSSSDPDERELIKWFYDNKIVRSGFTKQEILQDIQNAKLLANRPKYEKRLSEVKEAIDSKKKENNSGTTTGQNETPTDTLKLSPQEERILARQGLTAKDIKS